jgi:hypothetical protein
MKTTTARLARTLIALGICALSTSARAGDPAPAWLPLSADVLAEKRAGLRIGGLDVSLDVWVRDVVDGRARAPSGFSLEGVTLEIVGADALGDIAHPLVNRTDSARVERDTRIRVRVEGFRSVFGSPAVRGARARLRRAFE